eukprot:TRINITY_DN63830_c0_g1_i1.p1 TRINITY_DN63830_c0_g1~~TRINITY_DN63830_c0_g1_i1.p1  ORF type:complete len:483 (+),score=113.75 TRINITY_DN63830_c0_g1_i1:81-1529(+)
MDQVRIWDEWGKEQNVEECEAWDDWDKCAAAPGFPKGLVNFLKDTTRGCGFAAPTPIQSYSWPALVTGKDFIGVAKTGSGKTLAFLLPAFMWLKKNKKSDDPVDCAHGPAILVMTPTRELCYQIYSDAEKFGTPVKITAACAYGGAPKWEQEKMLRDGPETLIATPGRLADFCRNKAVSLDNCRYVTLDEADRMLDMGFEPQVREILDWVPKQRQVSMFTATWPQSIRELANKYIYNPSQVQVGRIDLAANEDVTQHIEIVAGEDDKKAALKRIIENNRGHCLVFCNTKKKVRDLAWELHPNAVELHGDLTQAQRDESLNKFKRGDATVLIATDIASRGLDVRSVSAVVNYDAPNKCEEDYVHRIGRTGRAGDKGDAYTFLTSYDGDKAKAILAIMENSNVTPPDILRDLVQGKASTGSGSGNWGGSWDEKDKKDGGDKWWEKDDKKDDDKWWEKKDGGDNWWEKGEDKWWESDAKRQKTGD